MKACSESQECMPNIKECVITSLLGVKEEKGKEHALILDADKTITKLEKYASINFFLLEQNK